LLALVTCFFVAFGQLCTIISAAFFLTTLLVESQLQDEALKLFMNSAAVQITITSMILVLVGYLFVILMAYINMTKKLCELCNGFPVSA
jgi:hypothetical protein